MITEKTLRIKPLHAASSTPLIDDLTRKITAAYREAEPDERDGCLCPRTPCSCGATGTGQDYFLPDGTLTNSLCVHYLAFHREEISFRVLRWVSRLNYGESNPVTEELHGGRALESLPIDYFGKKRLALLEAEGIDLRSVYCAIDKMSKNDADVQFHLLKIFQRIPYSVIHRFKMAAQPVDLETENWLKNAGATEGYSSAIMKPLMTLFYDSDKTTSSWAISAIETLARKLRHTYLGNGRRMQDYYTCGIEKHQVSNMVSQLHDTLRNKDDKAIHSYAIRLLGILGPAAEIAFKTIYDLMRNSEHLERVALESLREIGNWRALSVPDLLNDLSTQSDAARRKTVWILAELGHDGREALPAILKVYDDAAGDVYARLDIRRAISAIDPSLGERLRKEMWSNLPFQGGDVE